MVTIEEHAFGTFVPKNAKTLIIGTFPTTEENRAFEFFYPNNRNSFWPIMSAVFDYTFVHTKGENAVEERKSFCINRDIALTDMIAKAKRINNGAADKNLEPLEVMDILSILKHNENIKKIILTSRSGNVNALDLFKKHLKENCISVSTTKEDNIIKGFFELDNIKINIFVPYSPSSNASQPIETKIKMFTNCLL